MLIGYARVATEEQDPDRQVHALARAGVEPDNIHIDLAGGAKASRPRLDRVLEFARAGDTLVVTRLDRIGRSVPHLVQLGAALRSRDIGLRVLEQGIDTATERGRAMFGMFTVLEDLRHDLAAANTREGRAVAAARGRRGGRPPTVTAEQARIAQRLYDEGTHTVAQIAVQLGVKRGTLYGYLDKSTVGTRPRARKPPAPIQPIQSVQQGGSVTSAAAHPRDAAPTAPGPTPTPPTATPSAQAGPSTQAGPSAQAAPSRSSSAGTRTGTGAAPGRPRLVDPPRSAQRSAPAYPRPATRRPGPRPRIEVIPGAVAPAHPNPAAQPPPVPEPIRTRPGITCPNCGNRPTHFRDRIRQRQDLALIWLYPDPRHPGRVVERRHCAQCQPHEQVASVECAHCADGPLLTGRYATAPDGLPEPVRRWLTARGWHIDGPRWTCGKHSHPPE